MTEKELERKRKRCKYALVHWHENESWGKAYYAVESKKNLKGWYEEDDYEMVCDTEPRSVLRGMLKLVKEG